MMDDEMYEEDYETEDMEEEPFDMPTSAFSQIMTNMDPEEEDNLLDPPGDDPYEMGLGAGGGASLPASPSPSVPPSNPDTSMDPHMVREDLREMLREREMKRKELQERYASENLAMNRGNL